MTGKHFALGVVYYLVMDAKLAQLRRIW